MKKESATIGLLCIQQTFWLLYALYFKTRNLILFVNGRIETRSVSPLKLSNVAAVTLYEILACERILIRNTRRSQIHNEGKPVVFQRLLSTDIICVRPDCPQDQRRISIQPYRQLLSIIIFNASILNAKQ